VAVSFIFLFTQPIMVFASTKVFDDEIENRTMLILMSKPVSRTQVVLGKYLGVLLLVLFSVVTLSIMTGMCSFLRYFDDMSLDYRVSDVEAIKALDYGNYKAFMALLPSVVLTFFQVAALAAISVAISTRFGLAANVTVVFLIYIASNLSAYLSTTTDVPGIFGPIITAVSYLCPALPLLDLNQRLIYGEYVLSDLDFVHGVPTYGLIWQYVGLGVVYTLFYIAAALSFGVALFRTRELV
jgi:ABC-type transport system involved in multi-copper enzyme maturation permease subunit